MLPLITAAALAGAVHVNAQEAVTGPNGDAPVTAVSEATATGDAAAGALFLELNNLAAAQNGCRVSFLVRNEMGGEIDDLSLEVAVFGKSGALDRLLRLNFGLLLEGKTRVRQFDLDATPCDGIGNVLVNDVASCDGDGLTPLSCLRAVETRSALDITFGL
ncbi:hypothetical protein L1787_20485 [Acuticoccus sp. M5D2P5]|uniref:hypothetical protein n=1 Tax=Acuticoccus kalidii TaxID=2910977 RepID=UPI001F1ED097|nr:hypothetical protein [Acuticoccus kalidii]MCF3935778.1 hypothetical protein [Acuticoccus kalidii]